MNNVIVHIPHSSTYIPMVEEYSLPIEQIMDEVELLTDHATDKIFKLKTGKHCIAEFSRVFCDVERFPDEQEPMFKYGRGFYYTHTDSGKILRTDNPFLKQQIYEDYYQPHHERLIKMVDESLDETGTAFILDCHSFSDTPFNTDLIKELDRPDVCIGTDSYHTPDDLLIKINDYFTENGYSVLIDNPYSGTMIPMKYYKKNPNVTGIMIELNRKLYMDGNNIIDEQVKKLNILINNLFNSL